MIIDYTDYIWGDKFKVDFINKINVSFSNFPNIGHVKNTLSKTSPIIVTHNGDEPVTQELINTYSNCKYWFGQNIMCQDSRCIPLPIGLENDYISGQPERKHILNQKSKLTIKPTKLAYFNCSLSTCKYDREPAYNYFNNKSWCDVQLPYGNYYRFCDDILDHQFMISPRGNGLDCHRSWEILYLNRYPVMKKYYGLQKLFEDLPVVFVDNWTDVTEDFLIKQLDIIKNTQYNYEKLKYSFWKQLIEKTIKEIE